MDETRQLIRKALLEDRARQDVTTNVIVPKNLVFRAQFIAKQAGVICGTAVAAEVFTTLDRRCRAKFSVKDGTRVRKGRVFGEITGPARALLSGERTALNFLQHLSGVATMTAAFVDRAKGTRAKIYDTRKTIPGFRRLDKYAVRCGGGENHRRDLGEMALLKDNHLQLVGARLGDAVKKLRRRSPRVPVEIECENPAQLRDALEAGADIIMLDNMGIPALKAALRQIGEFAARHRKRTPPVEISGGVNLSTIRAFALLGVDRISVGAITHSAPALDISMEFVTY